MKKKSHEGGLATSSKRARRDSEGADLGSLEAQGTINSAAGSHGPATTTSSTVGNEEIPNSIGGGEQPPRRTIASDDVPFFLNSLQAIEKEGDVVNTTLNEDEEHQVDQVLSPGLRLRELGTRGIRIENPPLRLVLSAYMSDPAFLLAEMGDVVLATPDLVLVYHQNATEALEAAANLPPSHLEPIAMAREEWFRAKFSAVVRPAPGVGSSTSGPAAGEKLSASPAPCLTKTEDVIKNFEGGTMTNKNNSDEVFRVPKAPKRRTRFHAPKLPLAYGTMHTKYLLLETADFLRVAIFSANLIRCDWYNKDQSVYVQDFPRRRTRPSSSSDPHGDEFRDYLATYLSLQGGVAGGLLEVFDDFDFGTACVQLVASVPSTLLLAGTRGSTSRTARSIKCGLERVREVVGQLENGDQHHAAQSKSSSTTDTQAHLLTAQLSSLGTFDEAWLRRDFAAALHCDVCSDTSPSSATGLCPSLHIILPTVGHVIASVEGVAGGGSVPIRSKNVDQVWLQKYLRKYQTNTALESRAIAVPHIKSFLSLLSSGPSETRDHVGRGDHAVRFMLTGSHNLSKAAWGSAISGDRVRSWELSVFFDFRSKWQWRKNPNRTDGWFFEPVVGEEDDEDITRGSTKTASKGVLGAAAGSAGAAKSRSGGTIALSLLGLPYAVPAPRLQKGADIIWAVDRQLEKVSGS